MRLAPLVLFMFGGCALPLAHKATLTVSTVLIVSDCAVTARQLGTGHFAETNPILGTNPTPARLWTLCGTGALLNAGFPAAVGMGKDARLAWWTIIGLLELDAFAHNISH